jgi:hypothetical protein
VGGWCGVEHRAGGLVLLTGLSGWVVLSTEHTCAACMQGGHHDVVVDGWLAAGLRFVCWAGDVIKTTMSLSPTVAAYAT